MKYRITTPDADEHKEIILEEVDGIIISPEQYRGRDCADVLIDLFSVWKLYSTKYMDNVYPTVESSK